MRHFLFRFMSDHGKTETFRILSVVFAYWIVSISLVFINKWILSDAVESVDITLFVTWFQCAVTALLCSAAAHLNRVAPSVIKFPCLNFTLKSAIDVLPLSVMFVMMITLNNICLKNLNVSFYYLARCLTTVFNVIFSYLILRQRTSYRAVLCCLAIVFGYGFGVNLEISWGSTNLSGITFGLASSIFCALTPVFTVRSLSSVDRSVWRLTYYNNLNAIFLFIPAILLLELNSIASFPLWLSPHFWFMMVTSGIFGFAIGYIGTLQIHLTSALTHNVSGTAKAAIQTILAVIVNNETKLASWWLSNAIVLVASAGYAVVRHHESWRSEESYPTASPSSATSSKSSPLTSKRSIV